MSFTYDPNQGNDVSKIRFSVGDTLLGYGVLPNKLLSNVQDEEYTALIDREGTWQKATAATFEMLAAVWAREVNVSFDDQSYGRQTPSQRYAALANEWRDRWGAISIYADLAGGTVDLGFQSLWPIS